MLRRACQQLALLSRYAAVEQRHGVKHTTFLAGVDVNPNADKSVPGGLQDLAEYVKEKIPEEVDYRKHVERYCSRFLQIIQDAPSQGDAEKTLGKQFEEIEADIQIERSLIDTMARWKPWQVSEGQAPKLFAEYKNVPQNVQHFREFQHHLGTKGASS